MPPALSPLARFVIQTSGIHIIHPWMNRTVDPHLASILEIFSHRQSIDDAYSAYGRAVEIWETGTHPGFHHLRVDGADGVAVVIVGANILICPPPSADRAYQLANLMHIRAGEMHQSFPEELRMERITDVTSLSNGAPVVIQTLLRAQGVAGVQYPHLERQDFAAVTQTLVSGGLLTIDRGVINFGDLRRHAPFCPDYGFSRGTPIDRFYLDQFIAEIRNEVVGVALEIGGRSENRFQYGFRKQTRYVTMDIGAGRGIDRVGNAHELNTWPPDSFDSIILFNVLEHCGRPWLVADNLFRWLRPKGKVFCVVPNAQRVHRDPKDYWRILPDALEELFAKYRILTLRTYGNLFTSIAALSGVAAEELTSEELALTAPEYPSMTCLVAQKME